MVTAFERIQMLVETVVRYEPQLGLNAMEQPVKHDLLPYIGVLLPDRCEKITIGHTVIHPATGPRSRSQSIEASLK
jgi:hypothetical protein